MFTLRLRTGWLGLCAVIAASASQVWGATAAAPAVAPTRHIEDQIVTAEKRESTVSDTAIAITAFSKDFIQNLGLKNQEDLANYLPATTIQPYDITIRGIGRNFRTLGGDPGVSTYLNGVYSEDFGIASTENGLYDIERVEVLRGPQGTLYGRNAIGGAINFIDTGPKYKWSGEGRIVAGRFSALEEYGYLTGPLIKDTLAFRLVVSHQGRDGMQSNLTGHDMADIGDSNVALAFNLRPTDKLDFNLRVNDRNVHNRVAGATNTHVGLIDSGKTWDRSFYATGFTTRGGVRGGISGLAPGPGYSAASAVTAATPGAIAFLGPVHAGLRTAPATTQTVYAVRVRPGIDPAADYRPFAAFGDPSVFIDGNGKGQNLDSKVNIGGTVNNQEFGQHGVTLDATWEFSDTVRVKYIGGFQYFDYTFDLDGDGTNSSLVDFHFDVLERVWTESHELQLFWDPSPKLQTTSGIYAFQSHRRQVLPLFDRTSQGRIVRPVNYGSALGPDSTGVAVLGKPVHLHQAPKGKGISGAWGGDSVGTFFMYDNHSDTDAYAAFTQAEWHMADTWSLTVGLRYSSDEKTVNEDRFGYFEAPPAAAFGFAGLTPLQGMNFLMGNGNAFGGPPTCALTDQACTHPLRLQGLPVSFADNAFGQKKFTKSTFRINLNWEPNDQNHFYGNVTTGYRAGGFNLGLRSNVSATGELQPYDSESITAYELGYKAKLFDDTVSADVAVYLYNYKNYQDRVNGVDPTTGVSSDIVQNATEASNAGFELEASWAATEALTLSGNYSYTKTKYTKSFLASDANDPRVPRSLFAAISSDFKNNDLQHIPKNKFTVWAQYTIPLLTGNLYTSTTYSYTDEFFNDGFNDQLAVSPSTFRWDARAEWSSADKKLQVAAFINNITDEIGQRSAGCGAEGGGYRCTATTVLPRYYGVDLRYKFGEQ